MMDPASGPAAELNRLMSEAAARYNSGDASAAEQYCRKALALHADFPQALHLFGLCQWQRGELAGAAGAIIRALQLAPQDAQMFHDLGNVFSGMGEWADAARAYLHAIELRPDYADSYTNLGAVYENFGEHENAERAYRRALELNSHSATAAGSLASLAERANRLDEAEQLVTAALNLDPHDNVSNLTRAQLDFRAARYEAVVQRLEPLLEQPMRPRNRSLALAQLGAAYEMTGKYDEAFAAFRDSKESMGSGQVMAQQPDIYSLAAVERMAGHLPDIFAARPEQRAIEGDSPVFLVGFPRSGTTLLDQMLSSHPGLIVLEEKENLRDVLQDFATNDAGLDRFAGLTSEELQRYRQQYWVRVAEAMPERPANRQFIDKLPLNTIYMPLIARLFPQARFAFAVRDPRDVVLSCFMRAFGLNEAMRNFLSLEGTARYYAAVMNVGLASMQQLGKSVHLIRYETLIEDVEGEARRLCGLFGLPWDDAMLRFQETARNRRINTPSYHQVVQPIYKSARERWRNYEQYLQPVLPMLQPFLDRFGYR
ncbi:MAG TPA: sulfotransferase [Gammaproteobacteria bacterium]|nr:sulfotransferase [Gammaproteobacteria bacterium]